MTEQKQQKQPAADWLPHFERAGILQDELLACKSERSKAIKLGQFLSPKVGREVPVQVGGRTGKAVLRVEQDRAKTKRYFIEVTWDGKPQEGEKTGKKKAKKTKKAGGKQDDTPPGGKRPETSMKTPGKKADAAPAGSKTPKTTAKPSRKTTKGNAEAWE